MSQPNENKTKRPNQPVQEKALRVPLKEETLRVPLFDVAFGPEEIQAVREVLESGWLTMSTWTKRLEQAFRDALPVGHAAAVSNGTAALHLAHLSLGIGPGDEVITTPLTFVATANSILFTGATPVFADITGADDLNIDPEAIEERITPRTRAITIVHYAGYPCAMDRIMALARKHDLAVIEDCAHAPGASFQGKALGTWGDLGCFSFYSNKNMTCGEGGMVVTNDAAHGERTARLRSHGLTTSTVERHHGAAFDYDVPDLGYNYRIDEMSAALGVRQFERLEENNRRRKKLDDLYVEMLSEKGQVGLPFAGRDGVFHIRPVLLPEGTDRRRFMTSMRALGVQTSIHYPPVHELTLYKTRFPQWEGRLPRAEEAGRREVTLPLYPRMSEEDVEFVCQAVFQALAQCGE